MNKRKTSIKRFMSLLLIVAMTLSMMPVTSFAVSLATVLYIDNGFITFSETRVTGRDIDGRGIDMPLNPNGYIITQTDPTISTTNVIRVTGGTHKITLDGVNIDTSSDFYYCAFKIENDGAVELNLEYDTINTLKSGGGSLNGTDYRFAGLQVGKDASLTISGIHGTLNASARVIGDFRSGAGIGAPYNEPCGSIMITDGEIFATGGYGQPGIGSDSIVAGGGNITINDGSINATSHKMGAGISSNLNKSITIRGGDITATAGSPDENGNGSAGIGGNLGPSNGPILISGGTVIATGSGGSAGIGGGQNGNIEPYSGNAITITAGNVTAIGGTLPEVGEGGPGIGGSTAIKTNTMGGSDVSIGSGAIVKAVSKRAGASAINDTDGIIAQPNGNNLGTILMTNLAESVQSGKVFQITNTSENPIDSMTPTIPYQSVAMSVPIGSFHVYADGIKQLHFENNLMTPDFSVIPRLNNFDTASGSSAKVISVSIPSNGNYKQSTSLYFTVTFDQPVVVTKNPNAHFDTLDVPSLTAAIGSQLYNAAYLSGSGTESLTFKQSILNEMYDSDGISMPSEISLNGAFIKDGFGQAVCTSLLNMPSTANVKVDAYRPRFTTAVIPAGRSYMELSFNEGVYGNSNGTGPITPDQLKLSFDPSISGTASQVKIATIKTIANTPLVGGETQIKVFFDLATPANGDETILISPIANTPIYDLAGNTSTLTSTLEINLQVDSSPTLFEPGDIQLVTQGSVNTPNTLNATNTNLTASAAIAANQAYFGFAELYIDGVLKATDSTISTTDTLVNFDLGQTTKSGLQNLVPTGGEVTVKLYSSTGKTVTSLSGNPILLVDYIAPPAPVGITIQPIGGIVEANKLNLSNTNMIVNANITPGQVDGGKAELYINDDLKDSDTFIDPTDTQVSINLGLNSNEALKALIPSGGIVCLKLTDKAGNNVVSQLNNPILTVNYTTQPVIDIPTDPTAPLAPVITADNFSNALTPTWSWVSGGNGDGTFRVKLDDFNVTSGDAITTSLSYTPATPLTEGPHTLYVQEKNDLNLWSPLANKVIFIDRTGPVTGSIVTGAITSNSIAFSWTPANDFSTPPPGLLYKVVYSTRDNVSTLDGATTNGIVVKDWTSNVFSHTLTGLSPSTPYYYNVIAKDVLGNSAVYTTGSAITFATTGGSSGGGGSDNKDKTTPITTGGGASTSTTTVTTPANTPDTGKSTAVLVNGKSESAGTIKYSKIGDQVLATVTVDDKKIQDLLKTGGPKVFVSIPITGTSAISEGILNGQTLKDMEKKDAVLEIRTPAASYTLPASQVNIDSVSAQLGEAISLKDIQISIKIHESSIAESKSLEDTAKKNNYQLIAKPVDFEITCTSGNRTVTVSKFNNYVERTIALPENIDPKKISTGIVVNGDKTFSHIPTSIVLIDGTYYAKINSLTNSVYSVIYNPVAFKDVSNHWAKEAINNMGSRLILSGTGNGNFSPDGKITRAEFAAIIVRALGLKPEGTSTHFTDVKASSWYAGYVETAVSQGIVTGYASGKFGPNDTITREQALVMIARAMKVTGLYQPLTDTEINALIGSRSDGSTISNYAKASIASCLKNAIISGTNTGNLVPMEQITRGEVADLIEKLLTKSELINQ